MSTNKCDPVRILHISDLHIGESLGDPKSKHIILSPNSFELYNVIETILKAHGDQVRADFLVVTGDIISNANSKEERRKRYSTALEQIDKLRCRIGIMDKQNVLIIPGNHDVISPKTVQNMSNERRLDSYLEFINEYYEGNRENPSIFSLCDKGDSVKVAREKWCFPYKDRDVIFWPLITCYPADHDQNQDGKCCMEQIDQGERFKRDHITGWENMCCIVLAHHNFLPSIGTKLKPNRKGYSAESMSALNLLFEFGVMIVLHGHRHQDYIFSFGDWENEGKVHKSDRLIVGVPSIGYYEDSPNGDHDSEHDLSGFAMLELFHKDEASNIVLKKYRYIQNDDGSWYSPKPDVRFRTLRQRIGLSEFMTFPEGYRNFAADMLQENFKHERIIVMHYHDDTLWHNAFVRFFGLDKSDTKIIQSLRNWFRPTCLDILNSYCLNNDLLGTLTRTKKNTSLYNEIMLLARGECHLSNVRDDPFLEYLRQITEQSIEGVRVLTYIAEAIYCLKHPKVDFRKHVYFSPYEDKRSNMRGKFEWLLESILLARNIRNYTFSWLPFEIADYHGKSLVGIHGKDEKEIYSETFYVGFDSKAESHRYSVLHFPQIINRNSAEGPILGDLKALMRKSINPLSERLVCDFPLLKDGHVFLGTLCAIASIINAEDIWNEELGKRFLKTINMKNIKRRHGTRVRLLENLNKWVLKRSEKDWNIPWNQNDRNQIIRIMKNTD